MVGGYWGFINTHGENLVADYLVLAIKSLIQSRGNLPPGSLPNSFRRMARVLLFAISHRQGTTAIRLLGAIRDFPDHATFREKSETLA